MTSIINNIIKFIKPKSKLSRAEKFKRASVRTTNYSFIGILFFDLVLLIFSIIREEWISTGIIGLGIIGLCIITYKFNVREPINDKFLKEYSKLKNAALSSLITGQDALSNLDTMSLEEKVTYLEEKYRFDNSNDSQIIRSLIAFYDKHKKPEDEKALY